MFFSNEWLPEICLKFEITLLAILRIYINFYHTMMSKKNTEISLSPAAEAARYLENARQILTEKAGKKDGLYADVKYVKMAAGTAYSAALLILDEYLKQKEGINFTKPKSIEDYTNRLRKHDKKLLRLLVNVYDELHIVGYYHGTRSVEVIQTGLANVTQMLTYI
jgi:hypothetical protein